MTFNNEVINLNPGLDILTNGSLKITASETSSFDDFNFLSGKHIVHHRQLKERLTNCDDWLEFDGAHEMNTILTGLGNIEKYILTGPDGKPFEGMNLRLFDRQTKLWSIYWADSITGSLSFPVSGSFVKGIGHFYTTDTFHDSKIIILFRYDSVSNPRPTWSQAFSADMGKTWEWNWEMVYNKVPPL